MIVRYDGSVNALNLKALDADSVGLQVSSNSPIF